MKKPQIVVLVLCAVMLAVSMMTPVLVDTEGIYRDVEQMNLYKIDDTLYGQNTATNFAPLNTHHVLVRLLTQGGVCNMYVLGAVYCLLLLLGLWLIVKAAGDSKYAWTNYLLAVLLVFVFTNFSYTGYFKTLYSTPFTAVMLLLWFGIMLYIHSIGNAKWYLSLLAALAALIFAFIGTVNALIGVLLGICILRLTTVSRDKMQKYLSVVLGLAVIIGSVVFTVSYKGADYEKNLYNGVFFGVVRTGSVTELGLDSKLDELKGQFYTDELAEKYDLENTFYPKVSYGKLVGYYATHWGAAYKMVDMAAKNAYFYLNDQHPGYDLYSRAKMIFLPHTLLFYIVLFILYIGILIFLYKTYKERRPILEIFLLAAVMMGIALKIPVFLTGIYEISQSMFTLNLLFDCILVIAVIGGSRVVLERGDAKRKKFGVTQ